jgi:uncharacterized GH25 family protein
VLDGRGRPLAGAWVVAQRDHEQLQRLSLPVTSDADGRYRLGRLQAGNWKLEVSLSGYGNGDELITLDIGETKSRDVVLNEAAILTGIVFDAADRPAAGVGVTAVLDGTNRVSRTDTDQNGRFTFNDLRPGAWLLRPVKGHADDARLVRLYAGGTAKLDLTLRKRERD